MKKDLVICSCRPPDEVETGTFDNILEAIAKATVESSQPITVFSNSHDSFEMKAYENAQAQLEPMRNETMNRSR